jgi:hypothetical protein
MNYAITRPNGPLCVFQIQHNGRPVVDPKLGTIIEHGSLWAAYDRIDQLSEELHTSVACFRAQTVWL